jgi:nucleoid-associated protein
MSIDHALVHRLCAGQPLRSRSLPLDAVSAELLDQLKSAFFSRLDRAHGSFADEAEAPLLQRSLQPLLQDGAGFAEQIRQLAQALLETLDAASDYRGYLFCFVERSSEHHAAYLFLLQAKSRPTLDGELGLSQCAGLDFGQGLSGIKVDIREWQRDQHYAYLSCRPPKGVPALSEGFAQLTGFSEGIDKREETQAFLDVVEQFGRELPADGIDDYRRQVVDYCLQQERTDQPLQVRDLADQITDVDSAAFADALPQDDPVWLDRRSLQRYLRFSGRERDLSISFSSAQLNRRVRYDAASDTLSISGLPAALRQQLLHHLGKD